MDNKNYLKNFIYDYENYYLNQIGGKILDEQISYYSGKPFQRGYNFKSIGKKYFFPLLKYLAKKGWNLGKSFIEDISTGEDPKESMKKNLKRVASETLEDISSRLVQKGKRRKRISKKNRKSNSKKVKKIFKTRKNKRKRRKNKSIKRLSTSKSRIKNYFK